MNPGRFIALVAGAEAAVQKVLGPEAKVARYATNRGLVLDVAGVVLSCSVRDGQYELSWTEGSAGPFGSYSQVTQEVVDLASFGRVSRIQRDPYHRQYIDRNSWGWNWKTYDHE